MQVTINTCDSCGRTNETDKDMQFWTLQYARKQGVHNVSLGTGYDVTRSKVVHWCRECVVINLGDLPPKLNEEDKRPKPALSTSEKLEILIRDIAFEETHD